MHVRLASFAIALSLATTAGATPVFRVGDLAPARLPGKVGPDICFGVLGNRLLFAGFDRANGDELWRTDGAPEGVSFVKDLNPAGDSGPCGFVAFDGALYFSASVEGRVALWRTDGTSEGTTPLMSFASVTDLVAAGGRLFFAADDGVHGVEPWTSDGTSEGTRLVVDLVPGPGGSNPDDLTPLGDEVFFRSPSADGYRLYVTDGTAGGTSFLREMGVGDTFVRRAGDLVYFSYVDQYSAELWRTDGDVLGTLRLLTFPPGEIFFPVPPYAAYYGPSDLVDLSGIAVFVGRDDHGWQPWRSDGTPTGTLRIADVGASGNNPLADIGGFVASGGLVYFTAGSRSALWKTDGTEAGTALVREMTFDEATTLQAAGGLVFFSGTDIHGSEPWRSDGTPGGTFMLADIEPGIGSSQSSAFTAFGTSVFFGASQGISRSLWKTDGTIAGTVPADEGTHGQSSLPSGLTDVDGTVFFTTAEEEFGVPKLLWSSDGTPAGTRQRSQPCAIDSYSLTAFHGDAYFYAQDDCTNVGFRLWNSSGPVMTAPRDGSPSSTLLAVVGDTLFFVVNADLWKTDGTEGGAALVQTFPMAPVFPVAQGGRLLFFEEPTQDLTLWRSDGTAAGTVPVKVLGPGFSLVGSPVQFAGRVAFVTEDVSGFGLWLTDGSEVGTVRLRDVGYATGLTAVGRFLYYPDYDTGSLWRTDGTEAGTILLANVVAANLTGSRGLLFFTADDGVHGSELWTSTGYPDTTRMVRDILPGASGSFPSSLADTGGVLLFAASDGVHGVEPWQSDGTAEGTRMVADVAPGPRSSSPSGFELSGSLVFFSADDGDTGFELWAVPASDLGLVPGPTHGSPRALPVRK